MGEKRDRDVEKGALLELSVWPFLFLPLFTGVRTR
jgi:hypothetical protein